MGFSTLINRLPQLLAPLVGVLVASVLVWQASDAAFTSSTSNDGNDFGSGTVELGDNDSGAAMFAATNMVPGESFSECVEVEYTGSSFNVTPVKLYTALVNQTNSFSQHVDVVVQEGTGSAIFGDCSGFTSTSTLFNGTLAAITTNHTTFTNGLTAFTPSSGNTARVYKVTITLGADTPNTSQGDTASANFIWEIQSA